MASISKKCRIEITRTAERQIKKLDRPIQKSIIRFLSERLQLLENPQQLGKPIQGDKGELWRYRIGDYRLICDIRDAIVTVLVLEIGHRKDVYR